MDLKEVTKDLTNRENWRIEQKLERMIRVNPRYKHLGPKNRQLILNLITKYKDKIRRGIRPSRLTVRADKYYLYQNRFKLDLSPEDLKEINNLLDSFKS